jgi:hypothetical protein
MIFVAVAIAETTTTTGLGPAAIADITLEAVGCGSTQTDSPAKDDPPKPYPQRLPSMRSSMLRCPGVLLLPVLPRRDYDRDEALILMSTPAGRLNLLSASIVLAVA